MSEQPVVFLHVGAPKTGTTYVQRILYDNRAKLRKAGLLYPGNAIRSHFWASQDLRQIHFKGHDEPDVAGAWRRLVDEIRPWPGTSVIDHELLAGASREQVDAALRDLDFAEVHIVWTARDLARQLPAAWQERIKNQETITFREFLDTVHSALGSPNRGFWRLHAGPAVLARWSRNIPPERVHVITMPPPGGDPGLLWTRFAGVVGIDPDGYDSAPRIENASLSAAEAAVLRTVNESLAGSDLPWTAYREMIKHGLARALGEHPKQRIELPEDAYTWALNWSKNAAKKFRAAGYDIVGDVAELVPQSRPTGSDPDNPSAVDRAEAATRMLSAVIELLAEAETQRAGRPDQDGSLPERRHARTAVRRVARTVRRERGRQVG